MTEPKNQAASCCSLVKSSLESLCLCCWLELDYEKTSKLHLNGWINIFAARSKSSRPGPKMAGFPASI